MQPLTFSTNKHFIPVANKPLIFYPIEAVAEAGIKEVLITYNPGWLEEVKKYLGTGKKWGLKFTYVLQPEPKGVANIIEVCEDSVGSSRFVLHLGDNIFPEGISEPLKYFKVSKANALAVYVKHDDNTRLGVPRLGRGTRLLEYIEKPKNPPNSFGIPGLYFFDKNVFRCFRGRDKIKPSARGEYEINTPYNWLIRHRYKVEAVELKSRWLDPGKFGDWIESNQYLLDHKLETALPKRLSESVQVEGRVAIGKKCRIRDTEIRGPVAIGDEVMIKNSYIGPYTSIDSGCVIDGSHLENSVLMKGVEVVNVGQPINESLIGAGSRVYDEDGPTDWLKLFIGEKSKVKV